MAVARIGKLGIIGGPQGPKTLLDQVRQAVSEGNLDTLSRLSRDFLAVDANIAKCIDDNGNTIAHLALSKDTATLEYVIEKLRADVNAPNFQGRTPLHEAVTKNYVECCEMLLASGADDSVQSATLSTPFHTAAACGSVECMEVLLRHSDDPVAKVNELDKNKSSALHKCAFDGDVRVSRWLVEHGAAIEACDSASVTPLMVAVKMGQRAVTTYLLEQHANCNRQDRQGNTCIHFCAIRCDTTILKMLLAAGANPRVQNDELNNPLHLAALHQRPESKEWEELIALLLEAGCDAQQENVSRKTPADYVGRGLKKLFSRDAVAQRRALEEKAWREVEEEMARAAALRGVWKEQVCASLAEIEEARRVEKERLAKEAEELLRAQQDARIALEEMIETIRYNEEEIKRRKATLNKANEKMGR